MKFLSIFTPDLKTAGVPLTEEKINRMGKFVEAQFQSGILLQTGGLKPLAEGGAVVRSRKGKLAVKDGPYAETKEIVGGFGFIEVKSRDEAIEMTRNFLEIAGDGECALYPIEG